MAMSSAAGERTPGEGQRRDRFHAAVLITLWGPSILSRMPLDVFPVAARS